MSDGSTASVRSMTGFGSGRAEGDGNVVEVEARSVNHRHLKIHVRAPEALNGLIPRLEELVKGRLSRGTVYLQLRTSGALAGGYRLDPGLLRRLHAELSELAGQLGVSPPGLGEVAQLPGVVQPDEAGDQDQLLPLARQAAQAALDELERMRAHEGQGIADDLRGVAQAIAGCADQVEARAPAAVREQAERLRQRVAQLLGEAELAPDELAREVALLADKSDVSEEVQRLRSHVGQLERALAAGGPLGRKLEFLAQELHRETNTIGSKCHDAEITGVTLELKLLVERIREQVANLE